MAMPKKIEILGEQVSVCLRDESFIGKLFSNPEEILGLAILLESKIIINKSVPHGHRKKVLAHEVFHFALMQSGISQSLTPELEECLCQTFASLYFQLKNQGL